MEKVKGSPPLTDNSTLIKAPSEFLKELLFYIWV